MTNQNQNYTNLKIVITGGTGSFGQTVARRFLNLGAKEVRILSRDEAKQDAMRNEFNDLRLHFFLGDVRQERSLNHAFEGADLVFHAAALKQVPSCEFFPEQAIQTNILGSENVVIAAKHQKISKVIFLSTDKAVQPINAMGMTKALMEKIVHSYARRFRGQGPRLCTVRYGNVLYSRGSVIPLFVDRIMKKQVLPITSMNMTRFLLPLEEAVDLVQLAHNKGSSGDLFIRKSPAATLETLVEALEQLFNLSAKTQMIGIRHGEKMHETLATSEELMKATDLGNHFCIPMDSRDLNYCNPNESNQVRTIDRPDFTSENAERLDVPSTIKMLSQIPEISLLLNRG